MSLFKKQLLIFLILSIFSLTVNHQYLILEAGSIGLFGDEFYSNYLNILGPNDFVKKLSEIKTTFNNNLIPFLLGKIGEIPYGKTLQVLLYYIPQKDNSNYWCDYSLTKDIFEVIKINSNLNREYTTFILVDQGKCSFSQKAFNVQKRKGGGITIIADDDDLNKVQNINIKDNSIRIPNIIVPQFYGNLMKSFLIENYPKHNSIALNIKFLSYNKDGKVNIDLYLSSDDYKALSFFKEFKNYINTIKNKINFRPIYKYHKYNDITDVNNKINKYDDDNQNVIQSQCINKNNDNFCTNKNYLYNIINPRLVLEENMRQSCIFSLFGLVSYWNYMEMFWEKCMILKKPNFSYECSKNIITNLKLDNLNKINNCMQDLIDYSDSKIDQDYKLYELNHIFLSPAITLNGNQFNNNWNQRDLHNEICNVYIFDNEICKTNSLNIYIVRSEYYEEYTVIVIILIIFLINLILLIFYRRYISKEINSALLEQLSKKTIESIKNHERNKENKNQIKPSKINEMKEIKSDDV